MASLFLLNRVFSLVKETPGFLKGKTQINQQLNYQ